MNIIHTKIGVNDFLSWIVLYVGKRIIHLIMSVKCLPRWIAPSGAPQRGFNWGPLPYAPCSPREIYDSDREVYPVKFRRTA